MNPGSPMPSFEASRRRTTCGSSPSSSRRPRAVGNNDVRMRIDKGIAGARGASVVSTGTLPAADVRTMFDRIAPVYDVMNRVMTAGLDLRWRRIAAEAVVRPGDRVVDACCGTGDLAVAARKRAGTVTGIDFSPRMLERARRKDAGDRVGRGRPARAPVRRRLLRRGDGRVRCPQRRRPRARAARAAARPGRGRAGRDPRDHDAEGRAGAVLPALVRPDRARCSARC